MIRIENIQASGASAELRRIVVKLGSAVVIDGARADLAALGSIADGIARLRAAGVQVIVVSSGAIAVGRGRFKDFIPKTIPDRQALAAVGQVGLMHAYNELFNARGFPAAQVLLTRGDIENRQRYLNARYTLERLLDLGAVPVINENDTVTIDELKFGDNDELSALVATKMDADMLAILSVAGGLYRGDPARAKKGEGPIPFVAKINSEILALAEQTRSGSGTGGMATKLSAMQMATRGGVHGIIAGGKSPGILEQIAAGAFSGTYFAPADGRRLAGRERWIAFGGRPKGELVVDAGARRALIDGKKSLLPAGVVEVRGEFDKGELVQIIGADGTPVARGLASFSAADMVRIKGQKTAAIAKILGAIDYAEAVHRDNMTVLE